MPPFTRMTPVKDPIPSETSVAVPVFHSSDTVLPFSADFSSVVYAVPLTTSAVPPPSNGTVSIAPSAHAQAATADTIFAESRIPRRYGLLLSAFSVAMDFPFPLH